jgi:hypothetical protein
MGLGAKDGCNDAGFTDIFQVFILLTSSLTDVEAAAAGGFQAKSYR